MRSKHVLKIFPHKAVLKLSVCTVDIKKNLTWSHTINCTELSERYEGGGKMPQGTTVNTTTSCLYDRV